MANVQLAKNLKRLRKESGYTQKQISSKLNISRQAYSNYETGQRDPDVDTLLRLATIYGVSLEQLLARSVSVKNSSSLGEKQQPYMSGIILDSLDTLYFTKEESELLIKYREAAEDDRKLVRRLLGL